MTWEQLEAAKKVEDAAAEAAEATTIAGANRGRFELPFDEDDVEKSRSSIVKARREALRAANASIPMDADILMASAHDNMERYVQLSSSSSVSSERKEVLDNMFQLLSKKAHFKDDKWEEWIIFSDEDDIASAACVPLLDTNAWTIIFDSLKRFPLKVMKDFKARMDGFDGRDGAVVEEKYCGSDDD